VLWDLQGGYWIGYIYMAPACFLIIYDDLMLKLDDEQEMQRNAGVFIQECWWWRFKAD
jgi:hypothetical protein